LHTQCYCTIIPLLDSKSEVMLQVTKVLHGILGVELINDFCSVSLTITENDDVSTYTKIILIYKWTWIENTLLICHRFDGVHEKVISNS
jgi:hypothetical protein